MSKDTRIVYRGRGHSYVLDGRKVPGVTTILDNGIPKPALVGWAANTVADYVINRLTLVDGQVVADQLVTDLRAYNESRKWPEKMSGEFPRVPLAKVLGTVQYAERDAAGNRGTEVHKLAEALTSGQEIEVPDELAGHVASYIRFLDDWDPTDALLERVVVNRRWGYMGRLDMIATFPFVDLPDGSKFGGRTLVDIKTSRSGPFPEVALQLAGYRYCETQLLRGGEEIPMEPIDSCAVVWVRADGYDLYCFKADQSVHRIFLYAKQVADWLDKDTGDSALVKSDALRPPAPVAP